MVANGGALDLLEAHIHDSDNACAERSGDDHPEMSEVNGFAISQVVGGLVVVCDSAIVDFVELGGCVGNVHCEGDLVDGFVGNVEVGFNEEVKVSEDLMLGKSIEETHQVIIEWVKMSGRIIGFVRW